ncbi:hypothetical protein CHUAL_012316 [Chamberlinius hualienensis]
MALSRFLFGTSSRHYLRQSSKTMSLLLLVCYLYASIALSESNGAALSAQLVCNDRELSGLPRIQKICLAIKQMAETNQFAPDDYYLLPKDSPQKLEKSDPNHMFFRFGRKR